MTTNQDRTNEIATSLVLALRPLYDLVTKMTETDIRLSDFQALVLDAARLRMAHVGRWGIARALELLESAESINEAREILLRFRDDMDEEMHRLNAQFRERYGLSFDQSVN